MPYNSHPDVAVSRALALVQTIYDITSERTMSSSSVPLQRSYVKRAREQIKSILSALEAFERTLPAEKADQRVGNQIMASETPRDRP